jgi:hypothetical protein
MFKNLFKKKSSSKLLESNKADVILRLMFEVAMSDGSLDDAELELIKKRASTSDDTDEKISQTIKIYLGKLKTQFHFIRLLKPSTKLTQLKKKKSCLQSCGI